MATITASETIELGGTFALIVGTIALDSSYPTGGESLDLASNDRVDYLFASPKSGYSFDWDAANQKLVARYADYDAVADGPLIEVPNTTNLSTVTGVTFWALASN